MSDVPYLTDIQQTLSDETDAFGHRDYAAAIVHALTRSRSPFTVGLFGDWGVGKSTVLAEVGRQLGREGVLYVQFDAWRYEGEAFRRQFLKDVGAQLEKMKVLDDTFDPAQGLQDLYQSVQTQGKERWLLNRAGLLKLSLFFVLLVALGVIVGTTPAELFDPNSYRTTTGAALFLAFVGLVGAIMVRVDNTLNVVRDVVTKHRLEEPERFTEQFARMLGAVRAERLVIAIDNLDRLNAEDAVLFLNTVKTYLEPVIESSTRKVKKKNDAAPAVVVLIAADDRALRHHLLSRAPFGEHDGVDRQRYADEYLRKFFNASLHMRPVLPDDMRAYMEAHLKDFAKRWNCVDSLDDLVRIASAGLRHNPRRAKQWVNSLELRTRLIHEREKSSSGHVSRLKPPITDNIPMVAKLALIQEEWPDSFAELQRSPLILREWQRHADSVSDGTTPASWAGDGWADCASFLRATSHISVSSIRPYLRLRRSVAERDLPQYDQVHDALTAGDTEAVESVLGGLGEGTASAYGKRLEDILDEELRAGNVDGSRAVVRAAITAGPLRSLPEVTGVLTRAAVEPDIRDALPQMPLDALAEATRRLPGHGDAQTIWKRLFDELADDEVADGRRVPLSDVIAKAVADGQLDDRLERQIASWLDEVQTADPELGADVNLPVIWPLLRARPAWVTASGFGRGLKEMDNPNNTNPFESEGWAIMLLAIEQEVVVPAAVEQAGTKLTDALSNLAEDENARHLISPCSRYLQALAAGNFNADTLAVVVAGQLGRMWPTEDGERAETDPDDHEWVSLGFQLFRSADANSGDVANEVVQQFLTEPLATAYAVNAGALAIDALSDDQRALFSQPLAVELVETVHGDVAEASEIVAAIVALDPERAGDRMVAAASNSITSGYAETTRVIWESQQALLVRSADSFLTVLATSLQNGTSPEMATVLLEIAPDLVPHASEGAVAQLAEVMWPIYGSEPSHVSREAAEEAMLAIAAQPGSDSARTAWTDAALAALPGPDQTEADRATALIVRIARYLDSDQRARLAGQLTSWVQDEAVDLGRVAQVARGLSGLPVEVAEPLFEALSNRDASLPRDSVDDRAPVVEAALTLGKSSRSPRLQQRAAEFEQRLSESGFEDDQAVISKARDLDPDPEA
jgi:hypothetical protein